jgi:hypothetical protein
VTLAQHSDESYEWATSLFIANLGRSVLGGGYDFDPCTSDYWQRHGVVRAREYFTAADNAPMRPWPVGRTLCNPPGGLVREFFRACVTAWEAGSSVFWVGFALEQLRLIQRDGALSPAFRRCIWPTRIPFLRGYPGEPEIQPTLFAPAERADRAPELGEAPAHANYLLLMPRTLEHVRRFDVAVAEQGAVPF